MKLSKKHVAIIGACMSLLSIGILPIAFLGATDAAASPAAAVTLSGTLRSLPDSSGLLMVRVELPVRWDKRHSPTKFEEPIVARQSVRPGEFRVAVPASAMLARAIKLGNGAVNLDVFIFSGTRFTSQMVPAVLSSAAAAGNAQADAKLRSGVVSMKKFRHFTPMTKAMRHANLTAARASKIPFPACGFTQIGNQVEVNTRIGEIHVGSTSGLSMRWTYNTQADTTLSVGLSTSSPTGGWSTDGSVTLTNSIGTSGGFTAPRSTTIYSDGDMWYAHYQGFGLCSGQFKTQVVQVVGDSAEGVNSPQPNPAGTCDPTVHKDPLGVAMLDPNGGEFDTDRATALGYSNDATVFGFSFSGSTGFSSTIHHDYHYNNSGGNKIYVCGGGSGMMPNSKVLYSGAF